MAELKETCYDAGRSLEQSADQLLVDPNNVEVLSEFLSAAGAAGVCGYPYTIAEGMKEGVSKLLNIYINAGKGKVKDSPEFIAAIRQIQSGLR